MPIKILPPEIATKIAAGEVVERPVSVVKELVENAIDAGSTKIDIFITGGGISSLRVTDNGYGMTREDAQKCILRHATSKINSEKDLGNLKTLGFRGEALSSICAIAKVEITTKREEDIEGTCLQIEGGEIISCVDCAAPSGTTVIVKDLFYNTPARKKFLKSPHTEGGKIGEMIDRLALSNPKIAFRFYNEGKLVLQTLGNGSLLETIAAIHGRQTSKQLLSVESQNEKLIIRGFIGLPTIARNNRNYQFFFVNGRLVQNKTLTSALTSAYHTLLMTNKYPYAVLHLWIDPSEIDVNIHPAKTEIRFADERSIFENMYSTISRCLHTKTIIPTAYFAKNKSYEISDINSKEGVCKETTNYNLKYEDTLFKDENTIFRSIHKFDHENLFNSSNSDVVEQKIQEYFPTLKPVGVIFNTYILAEGESGLYIIDQHAAHERILFEDFFSHEGKGESQILAIPCLIELSFAEAKVFQEYDKLFEALGFEVELLGMNTWSIKAIPVMLSHLDPQNVFHELLADISENKVRGNNNYLRESALIMMACKAAVKAGDYLSKEEIFKLLEKLRETERPFTCPHGRPTLIKFSINELEKQFKRI